jgi:hypothetical protein
VRIRTIRGGTVPPAAGLAGRTRTLFSGRLARHALEPAMFKTKVAAES